MYRARSLWIGLIVTVLALVVMPFATAAAGDWLQYGGGPQHTMTNASEEVLGAANVDRLTPLWQRDLPADADGSPVALHNVTTPRGLRDLLYLTTMDGTISALDLHTGESIWSHKYGPDGCQVGAHVAIPDKGDCYTNSSPAIDPNKQYVYSYGLDGMVHKYAVGTGNEVTGRRWPVIATMKPYEEKGSSALSIATAKSGVSYLYVVHAGYGGDRGDYQGHVTAIDLDDGSQKVFNTLCSDHTEHYVTQGAPDCDETRAGVWARPGVTYDPDLDRIFITTGNGATSAGDHNWGTSVLALHPDGTGDGRGNPLDSYTPANFEALNRDDGDLGSSLVAIINTPAGFPIRTLGVQAAKDGNLRLLNLADLSGQGKPGQVGGELDLWQTPQNVGQSTPGRVHTQPVVWTDPRDDTAWLFVANLSGISGMQLTLDPFNKPVFQTMWKIVQPGSESAPLLANGVLYWGGADGMRAFDPRTGAVLWHSASIGPLHWEAPIVADGMLFMPDHTKHLTAYAVPIRPNDAQTLAAMTAALVTLSPPDALPPDEAVRRQLQQPLIGLP